MYKQFICFVLGYTATALVVTTTVWPTWAISSPDSATVLGTIWAWKGIWASCIQVMGGQYNCEQQASLMLTEPHIVAMQALMCTGICLSAMACVLLLTGMQCTRILEDKPRTKRKIMFVCSALFFTTGALTLISYAWYTALVVENFFSYQTQDNLIKYELGPALYLGYVNCVVLFCAGLSACCMPGSKADRYPEFQSGAAGLPTYTMDRQLNHRKSANQTEYV